MMRLGDDVGEDPFTTKLLTFQQDGIDFSPVVASRTLLQSLSPGEVKKSYFLSGRAPKRGEGAKRVWHLGNFFLM